MTIAIAEVATPIISIPVTISGRPPAVKAW
jgi:hypothetical protein